MGETGITVLGAGAGCREKADLLNARTWTTWIGSTAYG